jgi:hypothetical protein
VTHMKARDPKKAHEWIFPLDIGPCNALETGFDKLLLCGLWRTAYDVTPWGVGVQSPAMGAGWAAERAVLDHVRQAFPTTAGAEYFEGGFDVALDFFGHDPADAQVCA